ncbi:MAG: protocatechuate 3,4-dioxygenase subunit alpha [Beijerinckiaceae bacterium]
MSTLTPSQTVGPFFAYCLTPADYSLGEIFSNDLNTPGLAGQRVRIEGRVLDGDGVGIPDAVVEIWQADSNGAYPHSDAKSGSNVLFKGFGRCGCGPDGGYAFSTIKPGRVQGPGGRLQAPHLGVNIFARGLLKQLVTRIYFGDESANESDPVLALVPAERRATLIARQEKRNGETIYVLDLRLQEGASGEAETVFFEA